MAEQPKPIRLKSAKRRPPPEDVEKKAKVVTSRPASAVSEQPVNPGEIPDSESEAPANPQQYNTYVDTRPPADGEENPGPVATAPAPEPMAEQEEIDFPASTEKSSTPDVKNNDGSSKDEEEDDDFESLDPKDYGIDFDGEDEHVYEPPIKDESLPDLARLMAALDEGTQDPEAPLPREEPPSLFSRPENIENYKKITDLKLQLEEEDIGDYVGEFEEGVREDVLMIGSIGLEDVQEEELRLRDEHVRYLESEALLEEERKRRIRIFEEKAKRRAAYALWQKRQEMQRMDQLLQQKERLMLDRLQKSYRRAENQLIHTLEKRKGEVKTYFGDLMTADGHYGGNQGRRWKVDWDKTPQPLQIKLKCLRGVRDKLPGGRYIVMVSLYNRLGGQVMRWSYLKGQQWGGATLPVSHDGHFYNVEIKLDQSMFTVVPARPGVRPGMVLMFELFLLRGSVVSTDRVVAWGCFPIADGTFDIIEGKYKCPLLRGEIDHRIEKHELLEGLMASDLDHWMCNLYFEVVKLPRYLAGQKEYEVELQFSSGILAYPDRVNTGEAVHDGEEPVPGSLPELDSRPFPDSDREASQLSLATNSGNGNSPQSSESDIKKPPIDSSLEDIAKPKLNSSLEKPPQYTSDNELPTDIQKRRPYSAIGSRQTKRDKIIKLGDESDSDYEAEDIHLMKKEEQVFPVKGQAGLFYKKHRYNPVDRYHKKLFTLLPQTPLLSQERRKKRKLTHLEQLEEHKYSVRRLLNEKGRLAARGWEKVNYVRRQLLSELGFSQWRSREFWGMLLMFVLVFFIRIYVHYITQWTFLQALEVPINKLVFLPYTVSLNYQNTLLRTREEIGIVLLGPFGNILFFVILVQTSFIIQKVLKSFPEIGSKFVISYGIQAFLDPVLILIVDCALLRFRDLGGDSPIADFAKLYWHFYRAEGSGLAGILITIFLYFFTCFCAGAILYMYFLRLHNNGRLLDIFWRLHGDDDLFFMPYDLELSNQELSYIVKKAEQWRGEEGERRKVAVYDYIWEEEEENIEETELETVARDRKKEVTTHVSVHTVHLDGLRELYRHFLKLPDGAIIEVFGDLAIPGLDKDILKAVSRGAHDLENLTGSNDNANEVSGSHSSLNMDDPQPESSQNASLDGKKED